MFETPEGLKNAIMNDIVDAMEDIGEWTEEIVKQNVLDWVYNRPGSEPPSYYIREYDMNPEKSFWGSWVSDFDFSGIEENIFTFLTHSDPDLMSFGFRDYAHRGAPYTAIHGGNFEGNKWYGEDRRKKLAQYISTGYRWDWGRNATLRREFMPHAIEDFEKRLDEMVKTSFAMQGVQIFKGNKRRG